MSSIGIVKARLVEILTPVLTESQVIHGPVDVTTLRGRVFEVGGETTPIQLDPTSMDGSSGTETYTLILTATASLSGTIMSLAEAQALDDAGAAIAAIRADPSLGMDNLNATVIGVDEVTAKANAQGRFAWVRLPVEIFTTF